MSSPTQNTITGQQLAEQRSAAYNSGDTASFTAFYAEDAVLSAPTLSQPLSGREAIHLYESSIRNAMPDASVELINLVVEGKTLAHEFIFRATHTGALVKPEFTLPATGNSIELPMAIFVQLDDEGRVTQERRYLDGGTLLRLLGAP